jgi:hypothetical protein
MMMVSTVQKIDTVKQAMNPTEHFSTEDVEPSSLASVSELQRHLNDILTQLSPERLQVLTDFAAYLATAESEAATQELLAIPGLLEQVKRNHATPVEQYSNWRTLRSDV